MYRQAEFPHNANFLIVDKLIHGCVSKECKRKLTAKGKDVSVKDCLELMQRNEAVEATMRKKNPAILMSMLHMHETQPRNHKGMGSRTGSTSLNQNQDTRNQE